MLSFFYAILVSTYSLKEPSYSYNSCLQLSSFVRQHNKEVSTKLITSYHTEFLNAITLQIDGTIAWSDLGFILFWPVIRSNTLLIVIKSRTNILDITLEVPQEIVGGTAAVKFPNKV